jgi:hypothetical protein
LGGRLRYALRDFGLGRACGPRRAFGVRTLCRVVRFRLRFADSHLALHCVNDSIMCCHCRKPAKIKNARGVRSQIKNRDAVKPNPKEGCLEQPFASCTELRNPSGVEGREQLSSCRRSSARFGDAGGLVQPAHFSEERRSQRRWRFNLSCTPCYRSTTHALSRGKVERIVSNLMACARWPPVFAAIRQRFRHPRHELGPRGSRHTEHDGSGKDRAESELVPPDCLRD